MRKDLVQEIEGFDFEMGLCVETFLDENTVLIGKPYNFHDINKEELTRQSLLIHYQIGEFSIYQTREIDYSLDGEIHKEIKNELSFSNWNSTTQSFYNSLLDSLSRRTPVRNKQGMVIQT